MRGHRDQAHQRARAEDRALAGVEGLFESFTQLGPIARRVEDLELVLPIIAGPDGEDPHIVPAPLGDPAKVDVGGLRVAWFGDNGIRTPTPETITAVESAVAAIAATGAHVEAHVPSDIAAARPAWDALICADGFAWLWRLIEQAGTPGHGSFDTFGSVTPRPGEPVAGDALTAAVEHADDVRARLLRWMRPFDLLVCPVLPLPALRHGESRTPAYGDTYSEIHNLTGWPAAVRARGDLARGPADRRPAGRQAVARGRRPRRRACRRGRHGQLARAGALGAALLDRQANARSQGLRRLALFGRRHAAERRYSSRS